MLRLTAHELVNNGLMTLFFLLFSLEIKRELVFGELRDPGPPALPSSPPSRAWWSRR